MRNDFEIHIRFKLSYHFRQQIFQTIFTQFFKVLGFSDSFFTFLKRFYQPILRISQLQSHVDNPSVTRAKTKTLIEEARTTIRGKLAGTILTRSPLQFIPIGPIVSVQVFARVYHARAIRCFE